MDDAEYSAMQTDNHVNFSTMAIAANLHCPIRQSITECVDCGEMIPEKRKQAMPNAIRCIHCQTLHEED